MSILGKFAPKKTDEEIRQELQKKRDEMIKAAARFRKLIIDKDSGWPDFEKTINEYIDHAKKKKALTSLSRADEKTIHEIRLLDHEIFILNWVLAIPQQFIKRTENMEKESLKND